MDEMEAAMHGRRLARSTQGDKAPPTGKTKGLTPREMCFEEKEYDCHPYERRRKKGILETAEASHSREGITRPSLAAKGSRRKRRRSPEGSPGSSYQENGHREAKVRRRPSPVKGRPKDKHDPSRAGCPCRADSALPTPRARVRGGILHTQATSSLPQRDTIHLSGKQC
nr:PREDICTED: serine/arginine-rich splicing factor 7-like [Equus przewalskii]